MPARAPRSPLERSTSALAAPLGEPDAALARFRPQPVQRLFAPQPLELAHLAGRGDRLPDRIARGRRLVDEHQLRGRRQRRQQVGQPVPFAQTALPPTGAELEAPAQPVHAHEAPIAEERRRGRGRPQLADGQPRRLERRRVVGQRAVRIKGSAELRQRLHPRVAILPAQQHDRHQPPPAAADPAAARSRPAEPARAPIRPPPSCPPTGRTSASGRGRTCRGRRS